MLSLGKSQSSYNIDKIKELCINKGVDFRELLDTYKDDSFYNRQHRGYLADSLLSNEKGISRSHLDSLMYYAIGKGKTEDPEEIRKQRSLFAHVSKNAERVNNDIGVAYLQKKSQQSLSAIMDSFRRPTVFGKGQISTAQLNSLIGSEDPLNSSGIIKKQEQVRRVYRDFGQAVKEYVNDYKMFTALNGELNEKLQGSVSTRYDTLLGLIDQIKDIRTKLDSERGKLITIQNFLKLNQGDLKIEDTSPEIMAMEFPQVPEKDEFDQAFDQMPEKYNNQESRNLGKTPLRIKSVDPKLNRSDSSEGALLQRRNNLSMKRTTPVNSERKSSLLPGLKRGDQEVIRNIKNKTNEALREVKKIFTEQKLNDLTDRSLQVETSQSARSFSKDRSLQAGSRGRVAQNQAMLDKAANSVQGNVENRKKLLSGLTKQVADRVNKIMDGKDKTSEPTEKKSRYVLKF